MASKFLRRQQWWIKFRHPATGRSIRESLETQDEARAELLRERLDHEVALLDPRFQAVEIPSRVRGELGLAGHAANNPNALDWIPAPGAHPAGRPSAVPPRKRATVNEAVSAYLRFIASENAALHVANKVSILRRFLGRERVEKVGGPAMTRRPRLATGEFVPDPVPFFAGTYLDEITPVLVQAFLEGLGLCRKTMRHYREMFHHFFEFSLKFNLYHPTNLHRPNPISALPSYSTRNRRIIFLTEAEVDEQIAGLGSDPSSASRN